MANYAKGIIVEIGGDTSGLQKSLNKVNTLTNSLAKELKNIDKALKLDPKNFDLIVSKEQVLTKEIQTTSEKLDKLRARYDALNEYINEGNQLTEEQAKQYRTLQIEIAKTENSLNSLKAETSKWNTVGNSLVDFGDKAIKVSEKIDKLGTTLTTRLTLPIVALGTAVINSAKEFETAFTGVEKTVDGTTEQLEKLKEGIKDLAEEIPSTTTEISAVAESAGQLGIATDDILSFTKVMIDLGNSTNLSAEEASSALAKFANVTKMSSKDYDRLGSTIVALGNNFATTEADIVSMATRLASTGELTGLTEAQILALATAMSSVGIEAEAGGSAMSKLLKKIQVATELGGQELKDFAKVSGMTSEQFKKAFEEDATKALSAFLSGLNDTERNGKSAIAILEEMELKEVRLSNTILSLSNASDVLNGAVNLGTQAWEENTALTKEAEKRYKTLDSRFKTTGNKLKNLATDMGDKLTPSVNELLDNVDGLIDKFDDLSAEEAENIIKTSLLVASIAPTVKIIGTFGKTTGATITTIGNFSKAIANVKNGVTTATGQVGTFTKLISALVSPTGLAVAGITALTTATYLYAKKTADEITSLNGVRDSIDSQIDSWNRLKETREMSLQSTGNEIFILDSLANELNTIVDSNGRVRQGYEDRANFIVTTLNSALGTEMSLNSGIIQNYQQMQGEIDNLIEKKKAEILLNAYADEYAEALRGQSDATTNLTNLTDQMTEAQKNYATATGKSKTEALFKIQEIGNAIKQEQSLLDEYQYTIGNYEALQTASISGTNEQLDTALANMQISWEAYQTNTEATIAQTNVAVNEEVGKVANILIKDTSVETASQNLGSDSSRLFLTELNKNVQGTQEDLANITGVIDNDTEVERASGDLGSDSAQTFKTNANSTAVGEDFTTGIAQGINNRAGEVYSIIRALGEGMVAELRASIDSHSPSKETMSIGEDYDDGFVLGIKNRKRNVLSEIEKLGNSSIDMLNSKFDLSNIDRLNGSLSSNLINSSKNIFTTPNIVFNVQEMNEDNLQRCLDYINRKFGSNY